MSAVLGLASCSISRLTSLRGALRELTVLCLRSVISTEGSLACCLRTVLLSLTLSTLLLVVLLIIVVLVISLLVSSIILRVLAWCR